MTRKSTLTWMPLLPVAAVWMFGATVGHGIDNSTEVFLRTAVRFGDREVAVARSGGRIVKTPDTGIAREMVTAGVTRFEIPFDYYVGRARKGDLYRTGPTLLQVGRFSVNATLSDLTGLTLDRDDLSALGDISSHPGLSETAAKQFLVDLVRSYQSKGIRSLEPLRQGSKHLVLSEEVRALLSNSPYLRHYGQQVEDYVTNYPLSDPSGATEYFAWAKVDIGLKHLVRITKVTVWQQDAAGGHRSALIVTEQIYATRYFQASLQVDNVIADDSPDGSPAMFLVTINRGRCDLLDTRIARLLRPLILRRTRASTERTLDSAKLTLEAEYQRGRQSAPAAGLAFQDRLVPNFD